MVPILEPAVTCLDDVRGFTRQDQSESRGKCCPANDPQSLLQLSHRIHESNECAASSLTH
jgi:hypothetical protein